MIFFIKDILLKKKYKFSKKMGDRSYKKDKPRLDKNRGLDKIGDDLLSHKKCSTIGAGRLNFSVRNGKRWIPAAIVTLLPRGFTPQ